MTAPDHDLRRKTVHGLFWQFLGVGGQRVVQILGPMVLWRTLDPKDIGLFVILLAGIGVVEALSAFMGEQSSISSDRGAETHYLDTVFTVRGPLPGGARRRSRGNRGGLGRPQRRGRRGLARAGSGGRR